MKRRLQDRDEALLAITESVSKKQNLPIKKVKEGTVVDASSFQHLVTRQKLHAHLRNGLSPEQFKALKWSEGMTVSKLTDLLFPPKSKKKTKKK